MQEAHLIVDQPHISLPPPKFELKLLLLRSLRACLYRTFSTRPTGKASFVEILHTETRTVASPEIWCWTPRYVNQGPGPNRPLRPHMSHLFQLRRSFSHGRLKYLLTACTFAVLTCYYFSRNLAFRARSFGPADIASNSTLGVRYTLLVTRQQENGQQSHTY